ncbi:MAG: HEPN domain-containing protein [Firmicutes bacterium]|nr:HEPN domain-containing protein [Bacillota bacterium]
MRAQSAVWMDIAEDDLEAAEHCLSGKQYLWSLFMCQQAVEKAIKAIYFEKAGKTPPKKHDLIALAGAADILKSCTNDTKDLFRLLSLYYIETRYPDKRAALDAKCTGAFAKATLDRSKEAVKWLKSILK